jgi:hypothetical protein
MQIPKECKIEKCVSKDPTRKVLHNMHLTPGGRLIATDGLKLVALKVDMAPDETPGPVTPEAVAASRKRSAVGTVICNGSLAIPGTGVTMERPEDHNFPRWAQVIPSYVNKKDEKHTILSLDATLLSQIQEAFGSQFVTLTIAGTESPMVVKPSGRMACDRRSYAVFMPARVS